MEKNSFKLIRHFVYKKHPDWPLEDIEDAASWILLQKYSNTKRRTAARDWQLLIDYKRETWGAQFDWNGGVKSETKSHRRAPRVWISLHEDKHDRLPSDERTGEWLLLDDIVKHTPQKYAWLLPYLVQDYTFNEIGIQVGFSESRISQIVGDFRRVLKKRFEMLGKI